MSQTGLKIGGDLKHEVAVLNLHLFLSLVKKQDFFEFLFKNIYKNKYSFKKIL